MYGCQKYRVLLLILVAVATLCSSLPVSALAQAKEPSLAAKLAGNWRAEISESQAVLLVIRGNELEMQVDAGGAIMPAWKAKLVISKEEPDKHMDWVEVASGKRSLPDNKVLYQLAGNALLVIGGGPKDRPTRFYSGPGGEPRTLIFIRQK